MTRKHAKELLPILQAYADGKTIQTILPNGKWIDCEKPDFNCNISFYRIKPEENYTIEQNCGENRIEGGVLSVSGSVSEIDLTGHYWNEEKHHKPFEDTAELMVHYSKHFNIDFPPFYEPIIWVKRKDNDSRFLITGYDELDVFLEDCWQDLNDLHEQYVFLDGSCIGKEE